MVHISIIFLYHFIYFSVLPFRSEDAQPGLQYMLGTLIQLPGNVLLEYGSSVDVSRD